MHAAIYTYNIYNKTILERDAALNTERERETSFYDLLTLCIIILNI